MARTHRCCSHRSLIDVLDNFQSALQVYEEDFELRTMLETLQLSSNALLLWPGQLATQIVARVPDSALRSSSFLNALWRQAKHPSLPTFITNSVSMYFDLIKHLSVIQFFAIFDQYHAIAYWFRIRPRGVFKLKDLWIEKHLVKLYKCFNSKFRSCYLLLLCIIINPVPLTICTSYSF